jgi:hypothetical protein
MVDFKRELLKLRAKKQGLELEEYIEKLEAIRDAAELTTPTRDALLKYPSDERIAVRRDKSDWINTRIALDACKAG